MKIFLIAAIGAVFAFTEGYAILNGGDAVAATGGSDGQPPAQPMIQEGAPDVQFNVAVDPATGDASNPTPLVMPMVQPGASDVQINAPVDPATGDVSDPKPLILPAVEPGAPPPPSDATSQDGSTPVGQPHSQPMILTATNVNVPTNSDGSVVPTMVTTNIDDSGAQITSAQTAVDDGMMHTMDDTTEAGEETNENDPKVKKALMRCMKKLILKGDFDFDTNEINEQAQQACSTVPEDIIEDFTETYEKGFEIAHALFKDATKDQKKTLKQLWKQKRPKPALDYIISLAMENGNDDKTELKNLLTAVWRGSVDPLDTLRAEVDDNTAFNKFLKDIKQKNTDKVTAFLNNYQADFDADDWAEIQAVVNAKLAAAGRRKRSAHRLGQLHPNIGIRLPLLQH